MFKFQTSISAALLTFALGGGATGSVQAHDPSSGLLAPRAARITQFQGIVAKPQTPCGWSVQMSGRPGTDFAVFVVEAGQEPMMIAGGTFPASGGFGIGVSAPGCTQPGPWSRARVISESEAPMTATVQFH